MTINQWKTFKSILSGDADKLHVGLIIDSPWMPGYCGVTTKEFYAVSDVWWSAYMKVKKDFPDILFLPDWWAEYGMTAEPSGFGVKMSFYDDNLPAIHAFDVEAEDMADIIDTLKLPNPEKDGVMPLLLTLQKYMTPKLAEIGEEIKIVSTRGPMTIAAHLFSVTQLLLCAKIDPDAYHKLLKLTTQLCKDWLHAQLDAVKNAEGILVLDDITGFFGKDDYEEFAHPYLKDIFSAFPQHVKLFHNDSSNDISYPYMADLGIDLFNFTHEVNIGRARQLLDSGITLLGNIPPMSFANNTPDEVYELSKFCIADYINAAGDTKNLLLSAGGGVPMGAKGDCINAVLKAAEEFNN